MCHFKQLVAKPTRVTSSTRALIDHIATNRPDNVSERDLIPCGISDHDAVYMVRGMRLPKRKGTPKLMTAQVQHDMGPLINMQKSVVLPLWDNYELNGRKILHIERFSAIESENLEFKILRMKGVRMRSFRE